MRKIPILAGALALFTFLTAGGVSAFFTDRQSVSANLSVALGRKIVLVEPNFSESDAEKIAPMDVVKKDPQLINEGAEDIYVFCQVEVPTVVAGGVATPVFSYEASSAWKEMSIDFSEQKQIATFFYGSDRLLPLKPKTTSEPVFGEVKFLNPTGDKSLCGEELFVTVKMYSMVVDDVSELTKDVTAKNVFDLMMTEHENPKEAESKVDFVSKENRFEVGNFNTELLENQKEGEVIYLLDENVSAKNSENIGAVMFLKLIPAYDSEENLISPGPENNFLIPLKKDGNAHVFGFKKVINENEEVADIFSGMDANCYISKAILTSIQSSNLKDSAGEIGTGESMDAETLQRIYDLQKAEDGSYFSDEDEIENAVGSPEGVEVIENFPTPNPLVAGENSFVKEVVIKNISAFPQKIKVFVGFSDKEIEKITSLSNDNGASYRPVGEYFSNPPAGWSYKNEGLDNYLILNEPLGPGKTSPTIMTNLKVNFPNAESVRNFDVYVYAQSTKGDWDANI